MGQGGLGPNCELLLGAGIPGRFGELWMFLSIEC